MHLEIMTKEIKVPVMGIKQLKTAYNSAYCQGYEDVDSNRELGMIEMSYEMRESGVTEISCRPSSEWDMRQMEKPSSA